MTYRELELAGVVLYKCEGSKLRKDIRHPNTVYYSIDFTNSDPLLISIFTEFLRKILKVREDKLRVDLHLYEGAAKNAIEYWSNITSIPKEQFYRNKIYKIKNPKYRFSKYGTCKIRYIDKLTYLKFDSIIRKRLGESAGLVN